MPLARAMPPISHQTCSKADLSIYISQLAMLDSQHSEAAASGRTVRHSRLTPPCCPWQRLFAAHA
jgi:hypothetical protein